MGTKGKRPVRLVALVVMLMVLFAACGGPSGGDEGAAQGDGERPKLRVWLFKSFVTNANDVLERQVKDWAAANNVDVEIDFSTFADQRQKYVSAIEAGNPPDIGEVDPTGPIRYSSQLLEVTELAQEIAEKNGGMLPNVEPYVKFGDSYLGVPRYGLQAALFLRKDLMEAKGLQPPKTWEELVQFAQQIQDPQQEIFGFGQTLNRSTDGQVFLNALLWSYGGGIFDAEGKAALNSDANKQAFQFAVDLINESGVEPPGVMGWTDSSNNEAYLAGKLASTLNGASLYYALTTSEDAKVQEIAKNTILTPWPAGPNGAFTVANPNNWIIFKQTKHPELAQDLIRYLEDEKQFSEYLEASAGQAAPVYENRFNDPYWESDPNFQAILDVMRNGQAFGYPGPVTKAAVEAEGRNLLTQLAGQAATGGGSVDAVLSQGHSTVQEIVDTVQ